MPLRHVLVVDDHPETCRMLAALVQRCGHRATRVHSGEQALQVLAADPADLVILDAMMPGMDGPELLRRVREAPATAAVPVVMFSAIAEPQFQEHVLGKGANEYWVKATFDYGTIDRRLAALMDCP